jgi:hypothetical protein
MVQVTKTPRHVSGASAAHHQEVESIYVTNVTCNTSELTVRGPGPLTVNSEVILNTAFQFW